MFARLQHQPQPSLQPNTALAQGLTTTLGPSIAHPPVQLLAQFLPVSLLFQVSQVHLIQQLLIAQPSGAPILGLTTIVRLIFAQKHLEMRLISSEREPMPSVQLLEVSLVASFLSSF